MQLKTVREIAVELFINGESQGYADIMTMDGLESMASFIGSPQSYTLPWMAYIALGSGDSGASTESQHLETERMRQLAEVSHSLITYYAAVAAFLIISPFVLREVGLINKSANGRLAAHWTLDSDYSLLVGDIVNVTCKIYIA